jgi:hypothetical protein
VPERAWGHEARIASQRNVVSVVGVVGGECVVHSLLGLRCHVRSPKSNEPFRLYKSLHKSPCPSSGQGASPGVPPS